MIDERLQRVESGNRAIHDALDELVRYLVEFLEQEVQQEQVRFRSFRSHARERAV